MNDKNEVFCYSDVKDAKILFGAYRSEKDQLSWIVGLKTHRYEKLYNVRLNNDIFSTRNGGIVSSAKPDYILIYDTANPKVGYHLFPCISQSIKREDEMQVLKYPTPNVFTSEIKAHAIKVLQENHSAETIHGDITKVSTNEIPDFDILCVGFPCQAFSAPERDRDLQLLVYHITN